MGKSKIAFIVEGAKTEQLIVRSLCNYVLLKDNIEIIALSSSCNIYDLWSSLKEYDFDADLIDIINDINKHDKDFIKKFGIINKEKFSEIFLFFDYDGHQNNLAPKYNGDVVVEEMLNTFDNETELGKLIISYPMVEAIRDYSEEFGVCYRCTTEAYINSNYKKQTSEFHRYQHMNKLILKDWNELLIIYLNRCKCLLDLSSISEYVYKEISPKVVFENQLVKFMKPFKKVMVLSAFVEFIVEYYGKYLFNENDELNFIEFIGNLNEVYSI